MKNPKPKRGSCDPMKPKDASCSLKGYVGAQGAFSEISRKRGMEKTASASMKKLPTVTPKAGGVATDKKGNIKKKKK
jgi:hypothetical protein